MTKLIMTSRNHEDTFCHSTAFQPDCWFGYTQAPKKVEKFYATQTKNPMRKNDMSSGILRSRPFQTTKQT